jgi:acyl-CoA-binding protein
MSNIYGDKLEEAFREAKQDVDKWRFFPSLHESVDLYGLFQQATVGDVNTGTYSATLYQKNLNISLVTERPVPGDEQHKPDAPLRWDAWAKYKGFSKPDAMLRFIERAALIREEHDPAARIAQPIQSTLYYQGILYDSIGRELFR